MRDVFFLFWNTIPVYFRTPYFVYRCCFCYCGIFYLIHKCLNTGVHFDNGLVFSASCLRVPVYARLSNTHVSEYRCTVHQKIREFFFMEVNLVYCWLHTCLCYANTGVQYRLPVYIFKPMIVFQNVYRTTSFF